MRSTLRFPIVLPALFATAAAAGGQITVPSGFTVSVYPIGTQVTGIDVAPPGPYGEQLYASVSGAVRVVDPLTGAVTPFAGGLAGGTGLPSGIEFDEGTFGTGQLFVAQRTGSVVTVDPAGVVSPFASGGGLTNCNDITLADPSGPFGAAAFVSNGANPNGTISAIRANGTVIPFASGSFLSAVGLAFPPPGSPYGTSLYVADITAGMIRRVDPTGAVTTFVMFLNFPLDLAFSRGGLFGERLYFSDWGSNDIFTLSPSGGIMPFASGFTIHNGDGDIVFDAAGDALYVASGTEVVRISDEPGIPYCYGNGAHVPCPCGNTAPLPARTGCIHSLGFGGRLDTSGTGSLTAADLTLSASQLPPNQFCILFAGTNLVPAAAIGDGLRCVGGSLIRLGIRPTGSAGEASWGPGLNAALGWSAGDVRRFQVWYRDPVGSPCGTGFNVTNASQVAAAP